VNKQEILQINIKKFYVYILRLGPLKRGIIGFAISLILLIAIGTGLGLIPVFTKPSEKSSKI
jgi:hypothetical protein